VISVLLTKSKLCSMAGGRRFEKAGDQSPNFSAHPSERCDLTGRSRQRCYRLISPLRLCNLAGRLSKSSGHARPQSCNLLSRVCAGLQDIWAGGPHLGESMTPEKISAFPILGCPISRVLCEKWALARRTNLLPLLLRNSGVKMHVSLDSISANCGRAESK
jgi:hypothetical protein